MSNYKKRLIITEDDRQYIKRLYGIIVEQKDYVINVEPDYSATPPPVEFDKSTVEEFTEKVNFQAGYHSQQYMKSANLVEKLNSIISTISKSPEFKYSEGLGAKYQLTITTYAGESQIPNVDYENQTKILSPGELAKMRQTTIDEFIREYINSNLPKISTASGEGIIQYKSKQTEPKIGETEWVGSFFCKNSSEARSTCVTNYFTGLRQCGIIKGKNPSVGAPGPNCNQKFLDYHKKYESEQFISVNVKLIKLEKDIIRGLTPLKPTSINFPDKVKAPGIERCMRSFSIDINYIGGKSHTCNNAIYEVIINGEKIKRNDGLEYMTLNNDGLLDNAGANYMSEKIMSKDYGGKRYNKMVVRDEQITNIVNSSSKELTVTIKCVNLAEYLEIDSIDKKYRKGSAIETRAGNLYFKNGEFIHKEWKNGCHRSVGQIIISNAQGKRYTIDSFSTPTEKNGVATFIIKDPCELTNIIVPPPPL